MTIQSKTYGKSSGRTYSDVVAGYDVPFSALDLSLSFDTMETKSTIENLEGEIWKPILDYEGLYEVSNKGRVKSLNYGGRKGYVRLMKPTKWKEGCYLGILLHDGKTRKRKAIHRLVYEAFNGRLPKYDRHAGADKMFVINHLDENKYNNCLENLELTTQRGNNSHGTRVQRAADAQRNKHGSKKVYQFTLDGVLVRIWPSTAECGRNGFNEGQVASCCRGVKVGTYHNVYKGFIWSYTNNCKIMM